MKKIGEGSYKGTHWMQDPKNKPRVLAMIRKAHRARARNRRTSKAEKIISKAVKKRRATKGDSQDTILVLNGWRILLGHNSIKIEQG